MLNWGDKRVQTLFIYYIAFIKHEAHITPEKLVQHKGYKHIPGVYQDEIKCLERACTIKTIIMLILQNSPNLSSLVGTDTG